GTSGNWLSPLSARVLHPSVSASTGVEHDDPLADPRSLSDRFSVRSRPCPSRPKARARTGARPSPPPPPRGRRRPPPPAPRPAHAKQRTDARPGSGPQPERFGRFAAVCPNDGGVQKGPGHL